MNIVEYVIANYDSLPKSKFDNEECVIVQEKENDDYGYGHHSYEGVGVNKQGQIVWCFSSGCSCNGSAGLTEHSDEKTIKTLIVNGLDLSKINPEGFDFDSLVVTFESY